MEWSWYFVHQGGLERTWSCTQSAEAGAVAETGDTMTGTAGHINQTQVQRQRSSLDLQGQKGRAGQVK